MSLRDRFNRLEQRVLRRISRENKPLKRAEIIEKYELSSSAVDRFLLKLERTKLAKKVKPGVFQLTEMGKKVAKEFERVHARRREQRAKEAITCLKLDGHNPKSGLLLDLGCGLGYLTRYFSRIGIEAVGIDLSKRIKVAKHEVSPSGSFVLADGVKLPFKEDCFNTVILNDVLEHIPYNLANPLLNEVKRTLKVGGKLYISVENRYMIREGHTFIPFLTWFPRPCWNAIYKIVTKNPVFDAANPYTVKRLKKLCSETSFTYRNYTRFYAWNKMSNIRHVGDPTLRKIANLIRKLRLSKLAYLIAEKVSLILFICEK